MENLPLMRVQRSARICVAQLLIQLKTYNVSYVPNANKVTGGLCLSWVKITSSVKRAQKALPGINEPNARRPVQRGDGAYIDTFTHGQGSIWR